MVACACAAACTASTPEATTDVWVGAGVDPAVASVLEFLDRPEVDEEYWTPERVSELAAARQLSVPPPPPPAPAASTPAAAPPPPQLSGGQPAEQGSAVAPAPVAPAPAPVAPAPPAATTFSAAGPVTVSWIFGGGMDAPPNHCDGLEPTIVLYTDGPNPVGLAAISGNTRVSRDWDGSAGSLQCGYSYSLSGVAPASLYRVEAQSEFDGRTTILESELVQPDDLQAGTLPSMYVDHWFWPGVDPNGD